MAFDLDVRGVSLPAAASLSGNFAYCGVVNASGQVAVQTTPGGRVDGIIYSDTPASGLPVEFITFGGAVKVATGAAVSAGDSLQVDATGRAITYASGKAIGTALVASAAAGVIITMIPHFQS